MSGIIAVDVEGRSYVSLFATRSCVTPLFGHLLRSGTIPHCKMLLGTTVSDVLQLAVVLLPYVCLLATRHFRSISLVATVLNPMGNILQPTTQ